MIRETASLVISIILVSLLVFGWMNLTHSLRLKRVRREYDALTNETLYDILTCIDHGGMKSKSCTVLVAAEVEHSILAKSDVARSRYGGVPYAEARDAWPSPAHDSLQPASFLIQVTLDESFPPPWPGRLIVVFAGHNNDPIVRCYDSPAEGRFISMNGGPLPQRLWKLDPVRIPQQSIDEDGEQDNEITSGLLDYDPVVLLKSVDGLRDKLSPCTSRPADLLAAILAPSHCGYGFEISDVVQLGGRPEWLHEEIDGMTCPRCGRAMRFLFQFGDLNGGELIGSSGVCYVFGCDEHPECSRAIIQNTNHD